MSADMMADTSFGSPYMSVRQIPGRHIEEINRFYKGNYLIPSDHALSPSPTEKSKALEIVSLDHLAHPANAISTTVGERLGMTSADVEERHTSHTGAVLSVLSVKDTSLKMNRGLYGNGNVTGESRTDWLRVGGLVGEGLLYSERFVIRCYEVGTNCRASIETIANLLQEVACNHARSIGFSTDGFATTPSMRKRRLIWVTTRMHIEVDEYAAWGDMVEIDTWFQGEGRVGTRRDWVIRKVVDGEIIGRATSTWVMMNQDTRRLSRITDDIRAEYMAYSPQPPRWAFPSEYSDSTKKVPKLEDNAQHIKSGLMPRRGDLDMNEHVNNVTYIGWMLESLPAETLNTQELRSVTLEFRRGCKHDDTIESLTCVEPPQLKEKPSAEISRGNGASDSLQKAHTLQYLHLLKLAGSDIEINRGRTVWRTRANGCRNLHQP